MITWTLETRKVKDLKPHPKNPRHLTKDQLKQLSESIEKFGLIDKPIVTIENEIIGGHQRLNVLKRLKFKEVDCWIPNRHLDSKEIDELNIRLNKNTGDWDWDVLANEWDVSDLMDWGFTAQELAGAEIEDLGSTSEEEDSEVLEPGKDEDAITKLGDIYHLGSHVLVCGDSTDPEIVKRALSLEEPILMVTDPPYGVEYDPAWRKDIKEKKGKGARALGKVQNDDRVNWSLAWSLFPGSVAYIWHASKFCSEVQLSLEQAEFEVINQIIWKKQHFALSRGDYHWQHEPCWYAVRKGHQHNWQGARDQATVWEIANLNAFGGKEKEGDERTVHSTQKPLECMERPIQNNTEKYDHVYDPFLGSGTTLIACEKNDRICLGIELSPAYCDIIVKRWKKYRENVGKSNIIIRNGEIDGNF